MSQPSVSRRNFIKFLSVSAFSALYQRSLLSADQVPQDLVFTHGLASGDPLHDRVIIWSRAYSANTEEFEIFWQVALDADMLEVVKQGTAKASRLFDYTLKIDVRGLQADTVYYFRFFAGNTRSPIGKTRTLPQGSSDHARLAVVSCSNYVKGYFHAYREIAKQDDIDLVLHLGDYIYEYGTEGYQTPANLYHNKPQPRLSSLLPANELISLHDYRTRYALYRSDTDLQELHRLKPFIVIWDDHEFVNDAWKDGPLPANGSHEAWIARRKAATQAFYEWLPVRESENGDRNILYRSFEWGDLARLIMLDTRMIGRDQQLNPLNVFSVYSKQDSNDTFPADVTQQGRARELLGSTQKAWLSEQIEAAANQQIWQIFAQQVLFYYQAMINLADTTLLTDAEKQKTYQTIDDFYGKGASTFIKAIGTLGGPNILTADSWTGYPSAKLEFAKALTNLPNPVILSGDSHNASAANLRLAENQHMQPIGIEIGAPSISSPGIEEELPDISPEKARAVILETSSLQSNTDQLAFIETSQRGYVVIDIKRERLQSEWYLLDSVLELNYNSRLVKILSCGTSQKQFDQEISALFKDGYLHIPVVEVDEHGHYYALLAQSEKQEVFTLELIDALSTKEHNAQAAKFSFANGILELPRVSVDGNFYSASLELSAKNPRLQFTNLRYHPIE